MGSQSDWETMKNAADTLEALEIPYEARIISAHRTPDRMVNFAKNARDEGFKVIIAGAGGAAHLPGMTAAFTPLPVFGVPVQSKTMSGQDSLLSIVQMPGGIPVGTLAIGKAGAINAALLAAAVLALSDEDIADRLDEWREVLRQAENLPAVLHAIIVLDAWNELSVLQHAPWLGRLFAASILREAGITSGAHLAAISLGLKTIPVDRRRSHDRETRLLAIAQGLLAAAEIGMKDHDRLTLARTMMDRKLEGRRTSSKLPELVELVMAKPLVVDFH